MSKPEESAFELSIKEMKQIRYLEMLKKRKTDKKQGKKRFSDKLSMEAQLAMVMALDDMENEPKETRNEKSKNIPEQPMKTTEKGVSEQTDDISNGSSESQSRNSSGNKSFAELYEQNGSRRMKNDITDEDFKPEKLRKRALDPFAKVESAMEIVETVKYDMDDALSDDDNEFIDQIAQQNAVDKCNVWITANSLDQELLKTSKDSEFRQLDS